MTPKTVSPHVAFYKSFSRPAAKVFLGAIFVYQSAYWVWTKLETDEIRQLKTDEILSLEREIQQTIERKSSASGI